jgi:uncharacterized membrane protein
VIPSLSNVHFREVQGFIVIAGKEWDLCELDFHTVQMKVFRRVVTLIPILLNLRFVLIDSFVPIFLYCWLLNIYSGLVY